MILTYKFRIKDSSAKRHLARHARSVNAVWNYCCEAQRHAHRWDAKWPTHYDLVNATSGTSTELGILADTIGEVCRVFAQARNAKRCSPRFRSAKKSLGWIPFRGRDFRIAGDTVWYRKRKFRFWKSREFDGVIKTGAFVQDARGALVYRLPV